MAAEVGRGVEEYAVAQLLGVAHQREGVGEVDGQLLEPARDGAGRRRYDADDGCFYDAFCNRACHL